MSIYWKTKNTKIVIYEKYFPTTFKQTLKVDKIEEALCFTYKKIEDRSGLPGA